MYFRHQKHLLKMLLMGNKHQIKIGPFGGNIR